MSLCELAGDTVYGGLNPEPISGDRGPYTSVHSHSHKGSFTEVSQRWLPGLQMDALPTESRNPHWLLVSDTSATTIVYNTQLSSRRAKVNGESYTKTRPCHQIDCPVLSVCEGVKSYSPLSQWREAHTHRNVHRHLDCGVLHGTLSKVTSSWIATERSSNWATQPALTFWHDDCLELYINKA
jgi:hypothetical protein